MQLISYLHLLVAQTRKMPHCTRCGLHIRNTFNTQLIGLEDGNLYCMDCVVALASQAVALPIEPQSE